MAILMIASLVGFPLTPQAAMSGVMPDERVDAPGMHELALISRKTDNQDASRGLCDLGAEPAPPVESAGAPPPVALPSLRCARSIGPERTARRCSCSARGPPALAV